MLKGMKKQLDNHYIIVEAWHTMKCVRWHFLVQTRFDSFSIEIAIGYHRNQTTLTANSGHYLIFYSTNDETQ